MKLLVLRMTGLTGLFASIVCQNWGASVEVVVRARSPNRAEFSVWGSQTRLASQDRSTSRGGLFLERSFWITTLEDFLRKNSFYTWFSLARGTLLRFTFASRW
jgi:hypothetical protein